ncbi:methylated-DNA--[protein]-cysteine S-methyltransferase [Gordonia sp. NPDC003425]
MTTTDPDTRTDAPTGDAAAYTSVSTPNGTFTVIADGTGVVLASGWTDDPDYLLALVHRAIRPDRAIRSGQLTAITDAVSAYYAGEVSAVDAITVRQRSGPFLERAWQTLRTVVPGEPVSYADLAARTGEPTAVRAAGATCARNAAALFVPCHRVLRGDGKLGGFRYGLPTKQWLLAHEAAVRAAA